MKWSVSILVLFGIVLLSCNMESNEKKLEQWKAEIVKVEYDFCEMAKKDGLEKAFLFFAHESAVLMRNDQIIKGKAGMQEYFRQPSKLKNLQLIWKPDFVDVASSGDLAYTYGEFQMIYVDENDEKKEAKGIFHTVWKRDKSGTWKYVWD